MNERQLRKQLIRLAHKRPELRDEILPLVASRTARGLPKPWRLKTWQGMESRYFAVEVFLTPGFSFDKGFVSMLPKAHAAVQMLANAFVDLVEQQMADQPGRKFRGPIPMELGLSFDQYSGGRPYLVGFEYQVPLDAWPEGVGFGPWFDRLMARYNVLVED